MEMLEGLDDRALAIDAGNLQILRWGAEEDRVPLVNLEPAKIVRDEGEAEAFAAAVDTAREAAA